MEVGRVKQVSTTAHQKRSLAWTAVRLSVPHEVQFVARTMRIASLEYSRPSIFADLPGERILFSCTRLYENMTRSCR